MQQQSGKGLGPDKSVTEKLPPANYSPSRFNYKEIKTVVGQEMKGLRGEVSELSHLVESKLRNLTELVEKLHVDGDVVRCKGKVGGELEKRRQERCGEMPRHDLQTRRVASRHVAESTGF